MMKFLGHLLAFASSLSHVTSIPQDDPASQPGELGSWEVTRMNTFQPSGRPGSSTQSRIFAVITNPNQLIAGPSPTGDVVFAESTANCTAEWDSIDGSPYDTVYDCVVVPDASQQNFASWKFEPIEAAADANPVENVYLKFTLAYNVTAVGNVYYKVLEGTGHFLLPDNMEGSCGGSGVCSWYLKDEDTPYEIQPTITSCQGTC
ncbi:hypothetical protein F5X99DRAFT_215578 [Biscogniauxia marginata]|nr:hypothetical protein F5X99DRAFT_215578 [Biscogniauxia marginata]